MRQQHKHYYCIRAYADGWNIESKSSVGWEHIPRPFFDEDREYRVVPDEDGWLPWYGSGCPVAAGTMVDVRYRRVLAEEKAVYAHLSRWEHLPCDDDIVAYRIVEEAKADPYAELKAAAKDPTKQIRCGKNGTWADAGTAWAWERPVKEYEIRDKPKKIKLLAWVEANGNLNWRKEGYEYGSYWALIWKRIPSEDKEVEVEE